MAMDYGSNLGSSFSLIYTFRLLDPSCHLISLSGLKRLLCCKICKALEICA